MLENKPLFHGCHTIVLQYALNCLVIQYELGRNSARIRAQFNINCKRLNISTLQFIRHRRETSLDSSFPKEVKFS